MFKQKKADLMYQILIQIILIGLIFALFFGAASLRVNSKAVKQQILEKQTALLIDSAVVGMQFIISKSNVNGVITGMEIKEGKVFVYIDGLGVSKGYPYFTQYNVKLASDGDNFYVKIE